VENRISGKKYVGITSWSVARRWRCHCKSALKKQRTPFAKAIASYGRLAFIVSHVASARTWEAICEVEKIIIKQEHSLVSQYGYNVSTGGDGAYGCATPWAAGTHERRVAALRGVKRSPQTCARMSVVATGRKFSAETKLKMSLQRRGKKHKPMQPQALENIRQAAQNRSPVSDDTKRKLATASTGRVQSEETKKKKSLALMGRRHTVEARIKQSSSALLSHKKPERIAQMDVARLLSAEARAAKALQRV
jgi:group I intron endonuclease